MKAYALPFTLALVFGAFLHAFAVLRLELGMGRNTMLMVYEFLWFTSKQLHKGK